MSVIEIPAPPEARTPAPGIFRRLRGAFTARFQGMYADPWSTMGMAFAMTLIVIVALTVRVWGANFGLPYLYHPDEPTLMDHGSHIGVHGDYDPHDYEYPSGQFYFVAAAIKVAHAAYHTPPIYRRVVRLLGPSFASPDIGSWEYLSARLFSSIWGTLTVILVFLLGSRLHGRRVGLLAALVMALAPIHVEQSHYAVTDAPAAFFWTLSLWLAACAYERGLWWLVAASAFAAGMAGGTKYNLGLILVAPLVAIIGARRSWSIFYHPLLWITLGTSVLGLWMTTPFMFADWHAFIGGIMMQSTHYGTGHLGYESDNNWVGYPRYLWNSGLGAVALMSAALGMGRWLWRPSWRGAIIIVPLLVYYVFIARLPVNFGRTTIPLLPSLAVLAGFGIDWLLRGVKSICLTSFTPGTRLARPVSLALVALVTVALVTPLALQPALANLSLDQRFVKTDSRTIALLWINAHLPKGSRIVTETYDPPLDSRYQLTQTLMLPSVPITWFTTAHVDYVIVNSYIDARYWNDPLEPQVTAAGRAFYGVVFTWRKVWSYDPTPDNAPGPIITIYCPPAASALAPSPRRGGILCPLSFVLCGTG